MTMVRSKRGDFTRKDDPGEPRIKKPRVSVTEDEARILSAFALGRVVLEIGTGLGVSTRALASTAKCVWTSDIDEWVQRTIWPELTAECDNINCITEAPGAKD